MRKCFHPAWVSALFVTTAFLPLVSFAQEAIEEVVITGTRIEGTAKDGQLPVDVYTAADLEDIGSPSPVQFAKSLAIQGNTNGENSYLVGTTAATQFNLRALGTARTLSLLNDLRTNPDVNQNPQLA